MDVDLLCGESMFHGPCLPSSSLRGSYSLVALGVAAVLGLSRRIGRKVAIPSRPLPAVPFLSFVHAYMAGSSLLRYPEDTTSLSSVLKHEAWSYSPVNSFACKR